jgi:hypothetical protein
VRVQAKVRLVDGEGAGVTTLILPILMLVCGGFIFGLLAHPVERPDEWGGQWGAGAIPPEPVGAPVSAPYGWGGGAGEPRAPRIVVTPPRPYDWEAAWPAWPWLA